MAEKLTDKVDTAIQKVSDLIATNVKADDALKYSQAVLNLAHAKGLLETKGAGS